MLGHLMNKMRKTTTAADAPPCMPQLFRARRGESPPATSARAARSAFKNTVTGSFFPGAAFTNHESLPPLADAFADFLAAFPDYAATAAADAIRADEYRNLEGAPVCLDYAGVGLLSHSQSPPSFDIAYKSVSLRSEVAGGGAAGELEAALKNRIMSTLGVSGEEYSAVCTANRAAAFRLLAESYSFRPGKRLLTVYDSETDAVTVMAETATRKGAAAVSASFASPRLSIRAPELRKELSKKCKGLFVFPMASAATGARYPYLWPAMAKELGWHIALDAAGIGPKGLDTLGVSLIRPDFIICNVFKVFGADPAGFACLFVRKTSLAALEGSRVARSIGSVSIVPADGEAAEPECRGLDHADALGTTAITTRLRCLTNWLVVALLKLQHPRPENPRPLVRIYGPRVKFERGPSLAFTVFDWEGGTVDPRLVQKLAGRHGISLGCAVLKNIRVSDKNAEEKKELSVVNASLWFLNNFEDAYRLWQFIARFLDADFIEKERWRYLGLNHKMVEV